MALIVPTKPKPQNPVAWLALAGLFIWDLNDATGPKSVPQASLFLTVVAIIYLLAALARPGRVARTPRTTLRLIVGCLVFGTLMIPFRQDFHLDYLLSDVGTILFFVLCVDVAAKYLNELTSRQTVAWFCLFYVVIAVVAYYSGVLNLRPEYWWNGRWDPPYYMLFGGLALLARYSVGPLYRLFIAALLVLMLGLALFSGNRTQFALGLLFIFLAWASNRVAMFMSVLLMVGFMVLKQFGFVRFDPFENWLNASRFALLETGPDDSLLGRLDEVHDIWYHVTVLDSPLQTVFGRGLGATWQPITRVLYESTGEVFYLHTGPSQMMYRYGIIGFALFVYWLWQSSIALRRLLTPAATVGQRFWILGAFGFSLNFLFQNSLFDPPAVLAMATLLVMNEASPKAHADRNLRDRRSVPLPGLNRRSTTACALRIKQIPQEM